MKSNDFSDSNTSNFPSDIESAAEEIFKEENIRRKLEELLATKYSHEFKIKKV